MSDSGFGDSPEFLSFGAFETCGVLSALLVALYSFVRNPEGKQGENDQSEYNVYSGWRRALSILLVQLALLIAVLVYLVLNKTSAKATWWVLAVMLAPWAPVAGQVRNTVTALPRVRTMMINRLTRNELAAVVRERFMFGQRAICIPLVVDYAYGGRVLPTIPMATLQAQPGLSPHIDAISLQATKAVETENKRALRLGTLWTVDQGPQPRDIGLIDRYIRLYFSRVDLLAYMWTKRVVDLPCSPFPVLQPPLTKIWDHARILDMVDSIQQGGTISDAQMRRAMLHRHCLRCRLATRGVVEVFMESSVRSHTDMRPNKWLKDIGIAWRGNFERIVNIVFEAIFMGDARGERVPSSDDDKSPDFGDRSKGKRHLQRSGFRPSLSNQRRLDTVN